MKPRVDMIQAIVAHSKRYQCDFGWGDLVRRAGEEFASLNRWRLSSGTLCFHDVVNGHRRGDGIGRNTGWNCAKCNQYRYELMDHGACFMQDRRPIALVGQPYDTPQTADSLAAVQAMGIKVTKAPAEWASFHFPGGCRFIVYTRHDTIVRFLPGEQSDPHSEFAHPGGSLTGFRAYMAAIKSDLPAMRKMLDKVREKLDAAEKPYSFANFDHLLTWYLDGGVIDSRDMTRLEKIWNHYQAQRAAELNLLNQSPAEMFG